MTTTTYIPMAEAVKRRGVYQFHNKDGDPLGDTVLFCDGQHYWCGSLVGNYGKSSNSNFDVSKLNGWENSYKFSRYAGKRKLDPKVLGFAPGAAGSKLLLVEERRA